MGAFLGNTLGGFCAGVVFKVLRLAGRRLPFPRLVADNHVVFINAIAGIFLRLPALDFLYGRDNSVSGFNIKAVMRLDYFQRVGMDAIDEDMGMDILRIGVNGHKRLVFLQPHAFEKYLDSFRYLLLCRYLVLVPAHHPMGNGHPASDGFFSERDHLGSLSFSCCRDEIQCC